MRLCLGQSCLPSLESSSALIGCFCREEEIERAEAMLKCLVRSAGILPDHPKLRGSINELIGSYRRAGQVVKADAMHQRIEVKHQQHQIK